MIAALRAKLRAAPRDRGMTLVELLVYMILLGIVLGIIASVLINSLQKQREVVGFSEANNTGQTVTSAVDLAVLNAASFTIVPGSTPDSMLLITKTRSTLGADDANVVRCVGFYYDSASKKIYSASDMLSGSNARAKEAAKDVSKAKSWPVLAEGIGKASHPQDSAIALPVFERASDPTKVDINFEIATLDDKPPATFHLTSGIRGSGAIDNPEGCW